MPFPTLFSFPFSIFYQISSAHHAGKESLAKETTVNALGKIPPSSALSVTTLSWEEEKGRAGGGLGRQKAKRRDFELECFRTERREARLSRHPYTIALSPDRRTALDAR